MDSANLALRMTHWSSAKNSSRGFDPMDASWRVKGVPRIVNRPGKVICSVKTDLAKGSLFKMLDNRQLNRTVGRRTEESESDRISHANTQGCVQMLWY